MANGGTKHVRISRGWLQFLLAVGGCLLTVGIAWGAFEWRLSRMEREQGEQTQKAEDVYERVHKIETTQATMAVEQRTMAEDVREIKQAIKELAKPK